MLTRSVMLKTLCKYYCKTSSWHLGVLLEISAEGEQQSHLVPSALSTEADLPFGVSGTFPPPRPRQHLQRYLREMLLRSKAQPIHGVGSAVRPLPKLLGRLCEGHVGGDGAVDDGLQREAATRVRANPVLLPQVLLWD